MALSPIPSCFLCGASAWSTKLSRCQACKVVSYCGRDHQIAHRELHKNDCNAIKNVLRKLDREEHRLRTLPPDFFTPANLVEEQAGHFWGIMETRGYMRARYAVVEALLRIKDQAAMKAAHEHLMDMLRLCRSDNMGLRYMVPAILIRLNLDQDCYDFCEWWSGVYHNAHYDSDDLEAPYLDIKDADVFAPPGTDSAKKYGCLSQTDHLGQCQTLHVPSSGTESYVLVGKVPEDILHLVQKQLLKDAVVRNREGMMQKSNQISMLHDVQSQIKRLHATVDEQNHYLWPALLKPGKHLYARPPHTGPGTKYEMQLYLQYDHDSWVETPGALDVIWHLSGRHELSSEEELCSGDEVAYD